MTSDYRIVFGDIHNHNAHGYGKGSIERSLDIAQTHLDFFAFTGHSSWHDLEVSTDGRFKHFTDGFARLAETWPRVQRAIADANRPEEFVAFLGFEWHSNTYGDQCVIFSDDDRQMCYAQDIEGLRAFARQNGALLVPHHVAYPRGWRGLNWDEYDPALAPVVEIYSMHGCSESDHSPFPMKIGSPGGRSTTQTIEHALSRGLRFGFTASTDNHRGFPGAWGEGVMAALVGDLSRGGVLDAIRNRRTYALTGDRIEIDFTVNGALMGSEISATDTLEVAYDVRCRDTIDRIELVLNNEVVAVDCPAERAGAGRDPVQLRMEWGWGPWGDLGASRVVDWEFDLQLTGARLLRHFPCLTSGPFDEDRRHRLSRKEDGLHIVSYTSRKDAFLNNPNQAVVLEVLPEPDAEISVELRAPAPMQRRFRIADLLQRSAEVHTGAYPCESFQLHHAVTQSQSHMKKKHTLAAPKQPSFLYLRVTQKNGQMAWTSPVFID